MKTRVKERGRFHFHTWLLVGCIIGILGMIVNTAALINIMHNIELRNTLIECNIIIMLIIGYTAYHSIKQLRGITP